MSLAIDAVDEVKEPKKLDESEVQDAMEQMSSYWRQRHL
jgi:hypothetical protein